eukprot:5901183-Prymnesium_polylepis.1
MAVPAEALPGAPRARMRPSASAPTRPALGLLAWPAAAASTMLLVKYDTIRMGKTRTRDLT